MLFAGDLRPAARLALFATLAAVWLVALTASPARAQQSEADVFVAQAIVAYEDGRYDEALAFLRPLTTVFRAQPTTKGWATTWVSSATGSATTGAP